MGILLIGVVAALFFRNEPLAVDDAPSVEREELIDSRLRDRDVAVYTDKPAADRDAGEPRWSHPDILSDFGRRDADVAVPIGAGTSPVASPPETPAPPPLQAPVLRSPRFQPPVEVTKSAEGRSRRPDDFTFSDSGDDPPATPATDRQDSLPESFEEYTVQYGDTLSGIADRLLGSSGRYHEIYDANRDRMKSPDRLTVGATLRIPR